MLEDYFNYSEEQLTTSKDSDIINFNTYYKNYSIIKYKKKNIPEVKKSAKNLINNINSKKDNWLLTKINNHIKRTGIDYMVYNVLEQIISSDLSASLFCKSAAKQNSSERCQIDYLKDIKGIELENLPAVGNKTWRFISGTGEFIQTPKVEGKTSHSLDFRYTTDNYVYYIMAKVTTTQGGGQNQQRQEMLDIIEDMKLFYLNNPTSNIRFVLLLDGDSYEGDGISPFIKKAKSEKRILIKSSDTIEFK